MTKKIQKIILKPQFISAHAPTTMASTKRRCPSVLWQCWFGYVACKIVLKCRVGRYGKYNVSWSVNGSAYKMAHSVRGDRQTGACGAQSLRRELTGCLALYYPPANPACGFSFSSITGRTTLIIDVSVAGAIRCRHCIPSFALKTPREHIGWPKNKPPPYLTNIP